MCTHQFAHTSLHSICAPQVSWNTEVLYVQKDKKMSPKELFLNSECCLFTLDIKKQCFFVKWLSEHIEHRDVRTFLSKFPDVWSVFKTHFKNQDHMLLGAKMSCRVITLIRWKSPWANKISCSSRRTGSDWSVSKQALEVLLAADSGLFTQSRF
jgi:hypothetical protein